MSRQTNHRALSSSHKLELFHQHLQSANLKHISKAAPRTMATTFLQHDSSAKVSSSDDFQPRLFPENRTFG
jgi:hypothetical protein